MKCAALYCHGRVVTGRSHLDAWGHLSDEEKDGQITSGFFDTETGEFLSDLAKEHFYNKKIVLVRHGRVKDHTIDDPSLSDEGFKEVQSISSYLTQFDLKEFCGLTSPLLRCLQTTSVLQNLLGIRFTVNPQIMETSLFPADMQRITVKNHYKEFPDLTWNTHEDFEAKREEEKDFITRIGDVLSKLPCKCILVTHYGVVTNMAKLALCDEKVQEVPTASVTYIDNQEVKCLGRTLNEMHHDH